MPTFWKSQSDEKIKEALDAVYATEDSRADPFLEAAARETFRRNKW